MSENSKLPEVWMRGAIPNVPALLQPVAHALLQANEEVQVLMKDFSDDLLWISAAGMASPAFHLQHMAGVLDRLFTYASGNQLSDLQLEYLAKEGKMNIAITTVQLVAAFDMAVQNAVTKLKSTDASQLTDFRGVGRKQLPSTVIGLLVHTSEHIMRHMGQLLVTVNVLKAGS